MEIKEAVEELRNIPATAGFSYCKESREAVNTICNAIASGEYRLCEVHGLEGKINDVRDNILRSVGVGLYESNDDVLDIIDNILDFLKEACL